MEPQVRSFSSCLILNLRLTPPAPQPEEAGNELRLSEADAIMTFSQTIHEASARGTRDLVRYPGVNELFNRADDLTPKLDASLEESIVKESALALSAVIITLN